MKSLLAAIFFLSACCTSTGSSAQIVNIEGSRMQSDTVGWMGDLGAAVCLAKNTNNIFQVNMQAHLQYKTTNDLGLWLMLGDFGILKIGDNRFQSDGLIHIRYNRKVTEWLRWEFFGQFQNNVITQIDSRLLFGTGPRFKLFKVPKFRMYVGCLFIYEREIERTIPPVKHSDLRNSSYISFSWYPRDYLDIISTTYFQPLVKQFSDYRILNQINLTIKATPHFGLSLRWNYLHDRFPAGTAPRTTYNFSTGITYKLR